MVTEVTRDFPITGGKKRGEEVIQENEIRVCIYHSVRKEGTFYRSSPMSDPLGREEVSGHFALLSQPAPPEMIVQSLDGTETSRSLPPAQAGRMPRVSALAPGSHGACFPDSKTVAAPRKRRGRRRRRRAMSPGQSRRRAGVPIYRLPPLGGEKYRCVIPPVAWRPRQDAGLSGSLSSWASCSGGNSVPAAATRIPGSFLPGSACR